MPAAAPAMLCCVMANGGGGSGRVRGFPTHGVWRRPGLRWTDALVAAALLGLLYGVLRLAPALDAPFLPDTAPSTVSTDPVHLPYYAARSLLRMFAALVLSVLFTLVYATVAARVRRAERVMLPVLDILQSIPVLGFLSITGTAFLRLFPGSVLGLECAAVFAIFTAMAWNMTFALYASLVSQPADLDAAARLMRLTRWQRFWRLDVPGGMIPLIWNGMMSFGGAWFFLAASESLSVLGHRYALPGLGSYAATAIRAGDLGQVGLAIAVTAVLVIGVNALFWRPLTVWSERFRMDEVPPAERVTSRSLVLDILRRSAVPGLLARPLRPAATALDHATRPLGRTPRAAAGPAPRTRGGPRVLLPGAAAVLAALAGWRALAYLHDTVGLGELGHALGLGALTLSRVVVLVAVATLVWVPIGVWIGLNPPVTRFAQPVIQVLAAFPANLLFPFAAAVFLTWHIPLNLGAVLLMALGAQWYILFNVIAGAAAIPADLREATASLGVRGAVRWRTFLLPAVFPAYVTGGITAAGGAWNASIVGEVVQYGDHTLTATGLGAYITEATANGEVPKILLGISVMALYVVAVNRLLWRRLYALAETRYRL
ncbi:MULTISPECIES: ABC transporter permease [Streptomyces]|nr:MULTISPECIES: ABC transporter permease subunit [Streptomyces]